MDPRMAARRRTVAESRARRGLRRLLVALLVIGLAAVGLVVLRSGLFALETVEVSGAVATDPVAIAAGAGAVVGTPLIEVAPDEILAALEADPRIASASVERLWPHGLRIRIEERIPVAWVERGGSWEYTAADGVVVAVGEPDAAAPRIRAAGGSARAIEAALGFVAALHPDLAAGMVIDARSDELAAAWNGYTIRLGRPTDMAAKARALEVVIQDQPPPGSEITLIAPERPAVLPPTTTTTTTG